ncbi:MAG: hypothetical protein GEV00_24070 [Actinophytocola sp.]|nr:hypothetical protein [Actinophytocola sp.]
MGTAERLHRSPADASVAALVGYDNIVDAHVGSDGSVLVGRAPTGLARPGPAGPATVAVFAGGVRLVGEDCPGVPARVSRVTPGRGHHVLALDGAVPLLAQLSLDASIPPTGQAVRVGFDPALSAVLPKAGC